MPFLEKAIGGCDETGACKCIEGYTINNETMKCVGMLKKLFPFIK